MSKIKSKLKQYARGNKKEDGTLLKDDDDEKEELEKDIILKAINMIGGKAFWVFMLVSYCS